MGFLTEAVPLWLVYVIGAPVFYGFVWVLKPKDTPGWHVWLAVSLWPVSLLIIAGSTIGHVIKGVDDNG